MSEITGSKKIAFAVFAGIAFIAFAISILGMTTLDAMPTVPLAAVGIASVIVCLSMLSVRLPEKLKSRDKYRRYEFDSENFTVREVYGAGTILQDRLLEVHIDQLPGVKEEFEETGLFSSRGVVFDLYAISLYEPEKYPAMFRDVSQQERLEHLARLQHGFADQDFDRLIAWIGIVPLVVAVILVSTGSLTLVGLAISATIFIAGIAHLLRVFWKSYAEYIFTLSTCRL